MSGTSFNGVGSLLTTGEPVAEVTAVEMVPVVRLRAEDSAADNEATEDTTEEVEMVVEVEE